MSEQHQQPQDPYYYEDVIDLRELAKTLWSSKWIILAAVLLAALAAYLTDNYILSPQYEASAHMGIRRTTFQADLEPRIENPSSLQDYQQLRNLTDSLPELAESADVVLKVCQVMDLACVGEDSQRPDLEAALIGTNQLKLTVTCQDPERAAEFANLWAAEMIRRWNILYGTAEVDLDQIEGELESSRQKWDAAQQTLEAYLPESKVNVIEVQLEQAQSKLNRYLEEVEANQRIVRDARSLEARLSGLSGSQNLPVGEALSLIALQQRASGSVSGTQFQLSGTEILGGGYRVSDARNSLTQLRGALENQNQELESTLPELESEITALTVALENGHYKIEELEGERDRAKMEYQALAGYYDEARINKKNQGAAAYSVARAVIPFEETGQSTTVIVALAGIIGGMIAVGGVLGYSWWIEEEEDE